MGISEILKKYRKDIKNVRDFCESYKVKVCFNNSKLGCSFAYPVESRISIHTICFDIGYEELWSSVFHEICHIICYRNNIYKRYHRGVLKYKEYRRQVLRAELYVDRQAEIMFNAYFPNLKFRKAYRSKKDIRELRGDSVTLNILNKLKKEIIKNINK